jgi:hypothetical protein
MRFRALVSLVMALTLSLAVTAAPVAAAGVPDQIQEQPLTDGFVARNVTFVAQTFTAGLSGTLDQIDLLLGRLDPLERNLTVQIQTVSSGTPTGLVLASAELAPADVPVQNFPDLTFVSVVLPPSESVAGTTYAIVVSDPTAAPFGGPQYLWGATSGDPYPSGNALLTFDGGTSWLNQSDLDMGFKTFVRPSVPTSKDQCKQGGWHSFGFKNQGACIKVVKTQ